MKNFGIIVMDDQIDYITGFDYTNLEYGGKLGIPLKKHINNPKLLFETKEEAVEAARQLNKLVEDDDYYEKSEKIDILFNLLDLD